MGRLDKPIAAEGIMFAKIQKSGSYSRPQLAELGGYSSYHAIARGVVTPQKPTKLFFLSRKKSSHSKSNIMIVFKETLYRGKGQPTISLNSA